jgi:hypothetical protein
MALSDEQVEMIQESVAKYTGAVIAVLERLETEEKSDGTYITNVANIGLLRAFLMRMIIDCDGEPMIAARELLDEAIESFTLEQVEEIRKRFRPKTLVN